METVTLYKVPNAEGNEPAGCSQVRYIGVGSCLNYFEKFLSYSVQSVLNTTNETNTHLMAQENEEARPPNGKMNQRNN